MKIPYFPGCTLKATAKSFEVSGIAVGKELGIEFVEMPRWNCCGTVYSLATDDLMHQLAPVRNLAVVESDMEENRVVSFCSMCYNTLRQANNLVINDPEKLKTINEFMDTEKDYRGGVEPLHLLQVLGEVGTKEMEKRVKKPLTGLKLVPYYGCTLVRPEDVSIDDPRDPSIMEEIMKAMGADIIDIEYKTECCGSYQTITNRDAVVERTRKIIESAREAGGDVIILSCPLCDFNLEDRQREVREKYHGFIEMPVLYFTQLMALAMGLEDKAGFEGNQIDPRPLLEERGLLEG